MRPGRLALLLVSAAYVVALVCAGTFLPGCRHLNAAGRVDDGSSRAYRAPPPP
ncbi:MAG TPA: hypothetical protein VGD39_03105 [Nocardioides sp.]